MCTLLEHDELIDHKRRTFASGVSSHFPAIRRRHPIVCSNEFLQQENNCYFQHAPHFSTQLTILSRAVGASLQSSHQHIDLSILVEHVAVEEPQTLMGDIPLTGCSAQQSPARNPASGRGRWHTSQRNRGVRIDFSNRTCRMRQEESRVV